MDVTPTEIFIDFMSMENFPYICKTGNSHEHCVDVLKPSTFLHIAEKLLQMAATNCSDGGHYNTHLYSSIDFFRNLYFFVFFEIIKSNRVMNNLL